MKTTKINQVNKKLTKKEQEYIYLYSRGLSTFEIATKMKRSEFTVSFLLRSAMRKLKAKSISHATGVMIGSLSAARFSDKNIKRRN